GFLDDETVELYGMEAAGAGIETGKHAAPIGLGRVGVLHGARTYLMQDEDGQTIDSHSVSAGLDYQGVRPVAAFVHDSRPATYLSATDTEVLQAFEKLTRTEGIMPAIESSHALAGAEQIAAILVADCVVNADTPLTS